MSETPAFLNLPDLASEAAGGAAIACNDEFFAEKENLVRAHAAEWREHAYTDRGKWMDGWETRRFRPHDGVAPARDSTVHDWCIVRLGMPGVIRGVVVDTAFFRGNYPDTAALYGACVDDALDLPALETAAWTQLLPRTPLRGDSKNVFQIADSHRYTHVRLDIYPDGGVARLRVHGDVVPLWGRLRGLGGPIDLAALEHGAMVETCSDMFFGSRTNLIKPGPSRSMADGWETRRRRGPGHEWAIVRLATAGTVERLELDTSHFKGNAPARCMVEGIRAPGTPASELASLSSSLDSSAHGSSGVSLGWRPLIASAMQPHRRHVWDSDLRRVGPVTHLRVNVYPCGGIARLRAWGELATEPSAGLAALHAMSAADARARLVACCGSSKWADAMTAARPFEDVPALVRVGERIWWSLDEADHREAFAAHPKIGEKSDKKWSADEQKDAGGATSAVVAELAGANRAYEAKHGFIFIVCATGRTADQMLADLHARLPRTPGEELRTAAEEQAKITRLRLHKLIGEIG